MRMDRELSSFPLPPAHRLKLKQAGFTTAGDLTGIKPSELSKELKLSVDEALSIIKTVLEDPKEQLEQLKSQSFTALELLHDEQGQQYVITFSEKLDELLGGGVPLTKITEICGAPGIGKTQMCLQLSVDVQLPECFGGVDGEAVYIDTEGSFIPQRLNDIAMATVSHCKQLAQAEQIPEQLERAQAFTAESILSGVHYYRCHDHTQLIALTHVLPEFLKSHKKVRLVIVDSIAFPFRHDFEDYSLRTRLLNGMAQMFIKMATQFKLAVVLTNQMTTKVSHDKSKPSQLIPALGESWGHAATIRLILHWQQSQRQATLYKSPSRPEATVPYQITTGGIRDVHSQSNVPQSADAPEQARKRQRTS